MELARTHSVRKAIANAMAFLLVTSGVVVFSNQTAYAEESVAPQQKSHTIYFSLADEHGFPKTEPRQDFDCTDKIYSVVNLTAYPIGKHQLSILWIDPAESARENTQYAFHVREKNTRLWAWLSLSRATGAAMLQWLNPAAGLEEFIGPWTVEVRIDNNKIASQSFEVSC